MRGGWSAIAAGISRAMPIMKPMINLRIAIKLFLLMNRLPRP